MKLSAIASPGAVFLGPHASLRAWRSRPENTEQSMQELGGEVKERGRARLAAGGSLMAHRLAPEVEAELLDIWFYFAAQSGRGHVFLDACQEKR